MPAADGNGIRIFYERWGRGPRLLFLNGSGASIASSEVLIRRFSEGFDTAVHDQRGLGRTSIPSGRYTMADYAADASALLDHLGWASCRVVGVSFGGMVAQELAVTWPERIERLALMCTSPGGEGGASYPLHELAALLPDERASRSAPLLDTRFTPEWLASHPSDQAVVDTIAASARTAKTDEQRRGEREQLEARRHHDVFDRLSAVACPTLVASGRFDGIAPVANGQAIASRIPGAELRVYEGGHLFMVQDPRALPEVLTFLSAEG
jgi:3-oxoadipate enol-lactonase